MTIPKPLDATLWDESIPVAEDFYGHVNARWLAANPVPAEYPMWGAYVELDHRNKERTRRLLEEAAEAGADAEPITRLVGDFYASGMDEAAIAAAGIEPLRPFLDRIEAITSVDDLRSLNLDLHRHGLGALFGIGVEADFEDAEVYLAYVGQSGLGLPERGYYLNEDERSVALRGAYTAHIATQFRNLGVDQTDAAATAEAMLAFERRLAEASLSPEQRRDPQLTMNRRAIAELDDLMPGYRLGAYLREVGISGDTVCVDNPGFLAVVDQAHRRHPARRAQGRAALAPGPRHGFLPGPGVRGRAVRVLRPHPRRPAGAAAPMEAHRRCRVLGHRRGGGAAVRSRHVPAGGQIPGRGHGGSPPGRHGSGDPCHHVDDRRHPRAGAGQARRLLLQDRVPGQSGATTRRLELRPLELPRQPPRRVRPRDRAPAGPLGTPMDKGEWAMPAHVVNAYYHPLRNEIVFPAGILQPPFFYADADDAVNYGGIGMVMGHEITHGFDDTGSQFDAAGALRNWWTDEDRTEFERRANVLVEQFDGYPVADDVNVNGRLTLGENIADLGGIAISLDAMHEAVGDDAPEIDGLTPDQRFFLAYATMWRMGYTEAAARMLANVDTHSPSQYRVNGPLSNTPAFAAAFGVPDGSPMALPAGQRARIW